MLIFSWVCMIYKSSNSIYSMLCTTADSMNIILCIVSNSFIGILILHTDTNGINITPCVRYLILRIVLFLHILTELMVGFVPDLLKCDIFFSLKTIHSLYLVFFFGLISLSFFFFSLWNFIQKSHRCSSEWWPWCLPHASHYCETGTYI